MEQYLRNNSLQKFLGEWKSSNKDFGKYSFYCKIVLIQLFYWKGGKTIFLEQATLQITVPKLAMLAQDLRALG